MERGITFPHSPPVNLTPKCVEPKVKLVEQTPLEPLKEAALKQG